MQGIITIFEPQRSNNIMFKQVNKPIVSLIAILMFMAGTGLYGQKQSADIQELSETALSNFNQGSYRKALNGFRDLTELNGDDPLHSYYVGRCLVALNEEMGEAIELLYMASRQNVRTDAYFYLGRAYHLNYNFQEAKKYYERYDGLASKQDRKTHRIKYLIASCRSATEITASYNPYEVMNVTFMDLSDSLQYTQVRMKGGELVQKPDAYFRNDEDREELTSLMFSPKDPIRGDYRFYSGYSKSKKDGAQIFRVRKGAGKSWGDPQELTALNSEGNDILPYFDPIENNIYFASDGRYGVGGFDLFRSHYDAERDQWTEPVNLGFPVNSVADEYLLLPGSDLGMVLFFSSRQGTDSTLTVFRIHLVEPKKKTALNDDKQLREIAQLGGVAAEMRAELETSTRRVQIARMDSDVPSQKTEVLNSEIPPDTPVPVYQETLAQALQHQAVSDSLKDLSTMARARVRESDDPNDRWVWQKQIILWEKRARDEEHNADQLYAQMEQERTRQAARPAVNPPEAIEVDRKIGDLTVYRYVNTESEAKQNSAPELIVTKTPPGSGKINRFDILSSSPYNTDNSIPMDPALPSGTFYRIQLGAFGHAVVPDAFGGISPITGEHLRDRGLIKYYAGKFSRYDDASTALPRIHSLGYEDAFIVAWYNGMQVSTQKAKQLE